MKRRNYIAVLFLPVLASFIMADELPHIGYIYPAGGQVGTVFEITVGGKYLQAAFAGNITGENVYVQVLGDPDKDLDTFKKEDETLALSVLNVNCISAKNVDTNVENIKFNPDLTQKEKNRIEREKRRRKKNQKNDQFPDKIKVRAAIMDNCEPGEHELRIISPSGLSNKFTFQVGKLKEFNEAEPNGRRDQYNDLPSLPVLINGQIQQNDVDVYRFKVKKGMSLVVKADVRTLLPYLADAVPGWFQASMALYDGKGNELTHADNFRFNQEPVLFYDVPGDGELYLEIRDSIYRGREDFIYRVTVGELPFITNISPIGAKYDSTTTVSVYGKNLPVKKVEINSGNWSLPVQYIQVSNGELTSNKVPFGFSELPEVNELQAVEKENGIQTVLFPVIINGVTGVPGEKDKYSFKGKEGEQVYIETIARRLGSPLDSIIVLYNSNGEKLAENDDDPTFKWDGMLTHHSDSAISVKLPKDDVYTVSVADVLVKGGEEYSYRLRISRPMPDFALYSTPPNVTVPRGGSGFFRIHALRTDGFKGPIRISLKNISSGFKLDDAVIPEGKSDIKMTVSASYEVKEGLTLCKLEGTADLQGRVSYRDVTPSEEYMQAFAYKHFVPVNEQLVLINPPALFSLSFSVPKNKIFELTQGKESKIGVEVIRSKGFKENIQLQLFEAPDGISIRGGLGDRSKGTVVIRTEKKVPPGTFENLILMGVSNILLDEKLTLGNKVKREKIYATAPALPVVVLKGKPEKEVKKEKEKKEEKPVKPAVEITSEKK